MNEIFGIIISGIFSAFTAISVAQINNSRKKRDDEIKEAKRQQYLDDRDDIFEERLDRIEKKLDEHNHYALRFEKVDIRTTKIEKDIEYLKKGIENGNSTKTRKKSTTKKNK